MNKAIKTVLVLFILGILYFVWLKLTGIAIPCIFHKATGWLCPGCGITRMILCLTELDFQGAIHANPFLFVTGPFLIGELVYYFLKCYKGKRISKRNEKVVIGYCILLCLFGVARNVWTIV